MATEYTFTESERLQMKELRRTSADFLQEQYNNFANLTIDNRYIIQDVIAKLKEIILTCDIYAEVYQLKQRQEEKTKYMVREGDSLKSIAQKFYGDFRKWTYISYYNELKDPIVSTGTTLTIPELTEDQG